MANFISHSILAENLNIKKLNINFVKLFSIGQDLTVTNIDCFKKAHNYQTLEFFKSMIEYIIENDLYDDEVIMSFLYGHISHYVFDTEIHPIINNIVDTIDNKTPFDHNLIECYIDIYLLKNRKDYKMDFINDKFQKHELKKLINNVYKKAYNIPNVYGVYSKTIELLKKFNFVLVRGYQNKMVIKKLTKFGEKRVTDEQIENIFKKSIDRSKSIISNTDEMINNPNNLKYMSEIFDDISYDTGQKCKRLIY